MLTLSLVSGLILYACSMFSSALVLLFGALSRFIGFFRVVSLVASFDCHSWFFFGSCCSGPASTLSLLCLYSLLALDRLFAIRCLGRGLYACECLFSGVGPFPSLLGLRLSCCFSLSFRLSHCPCGPAFAFSPPPRVLQGGPDSRADPLARAGI